MTRKPTSRRYFLFEVVVFAGLACLLFRGVPPSGDSPVHFAKRNEGVPVLLGEGFPAPGLHHFSDGMTLADVIKLTGAAGSFSDHLADQVVAAGATLAVLRNARGEAQLQCGWLPARQRMALGIGLHPDRMSRADWETLPGIGARLAAEIELDRQNNGDFGQLDALERVRGIGPAKVNRLRPYFSSGDNPLE